MLTIVVELEEPAKAELRQKCIVVSADNNKKKQELQNAILHLVSNAGDDILEDRKLKETLDESAIKKEEIASVLLDMEQTMNSMETIRNGFVPVAKRVSRLFFVLTDLVSVDPMYQYSLEFFRNIYKQTIKSADKVEPKLNKKERKAYFIKEFTSNMYRNVSRSLFVKDKLLFSLLICLKIMDEVQEAQGGLNISEVRFLMTGGTSVVMDRPNPVSDGSGWLSNKTWCGIMEMSKKLSKFEGFDLDFETHIDAWAKIYDSATPQSDDHVWPGKWNELSILHKTIVMRLLRPDKVINMVQKLISMEEELGQDYIIPPSFDMSEIYADSRNTAPIIIVLSPGADPMTDIMEVSKKMKQQCKALSLGRGQADAAKEAIKDAEVNGTWVVLQNCHLAPSFMPILDGIIDNIKEDDGSFFRIWLTTLPSDKFPVTIVQNGVKATLEPPNGMRNNLVRSYRNGITDQEFDACEKPSAFKRLFYGLCFFNALILERRKFGPLGWNIPYAFAMSDLRISKQVMLNFLNEYKKIPYDALCYMVSQANYGGRVTDPQDKRLIQLTMKDYFNAEVVNIDNHYLTPSGSYVVPTDMDRKGYIEFTEELPITDSTEIFGLHENAEITSNINETNALLSVALSLQPRVSGG